MNVIKQNPIAIALWIVVLGGLAFGVTQTAIKASALFAG